MIKTRWEEEEEEEQRQMAAYYVVISAFSDGSRWKQFIAAAIATDLHSAERNERNYIQRNARATIVKSERMKRRSKCRLSNEPNQSRARMLLISLHFYRTYEQLNYHFELSLSSNLFRHGG